MNAIPEIFWPSFCFSASFLIIIYLLGCIMEILCVSTHYPILYMIQSKQGCQSCIHFPINLGNPFAGCVIAFVQGIWRAIVLAPLWPLVNFERVTNCVRLEGAH